MADITRKDVFVIAGVTVVLFFGTVALGIFAVLL